MGRRDPLAQPSASDVAARKALIAENLFSRKIKREESVRELQQLLAISRGNGDYGVDIDLELGEGVAASTTGAGAAASASASDEDIHVTPPTITSADSDVRADDSPGLITETSESSLPAASAPPSPAAAQDQDAAAVLPSVATSTTTTTTDTIATALQSQPKPPQFSSSSNNAYTTGDTTSPSTNNNITATHPTAHPVILEPIRNLWSNLTHNNLPTTSEREEQVDTTAATTTTTNNAATTTTCPKVCKRMNSAMSNTKLECSICLEQYVPNDTISWAKDGGDDPVTTLVPSVNNSETGCDHIFHAGCIHAWLEDHDDCPLCRRRLVHADAVRRFASWER